MVQYGLFVCCDWSDGWSVVGLQTGLFIIRSVEPSGRLAIQPTTDWQANHPSIYLIANQLTYDQWSVLEFPATGVRRIPVFVPLVGCSGASWPMPASRWSSFGRISSTLSRGYTLLAYPQIDMGTLPRGLQRFCDLVKERLISVSYIYIYSLGVCVWLALPCHVSVHILHSNIFSCCIQLTVLPIPLLVMG